MDTETELKHRHMLSVYASDAARYFAMSAANSTHGTWHDLGLERMQGMARILGFDLVKRADVALRPVFGGAEYGKKPFTPAMSNAVAEDIAMGR